MVVRVEIIAYFICEFYGFGFDDGYAVVRYRGFLFRFRLNYVKQMMEQPWNVLSGLPVILSEEIMFYITSMSSSLARWKMFRRIVIVVSYTNRL